MLKISCPVAQFSPFEEESKVNKSVGEQQEQEHKLWWGVDVGGLELFFYFFSFCCSSLSRADILYLGFAHFHSSMVGLRKKEQDRRKMGTSKWIIIFIIIFGSTKWAVGGGQWVKKNQTHDTRMYSKLQGARQP